MLPSPKTATLKALIPLCTVLTTNVWAGDEFVCVGHVATDAATLKLHGPAKPTQAQVATTRTGIVLFAHFKDELPADTAIPDWADDLFDPDRPGSVSHFYDTMSFGVHTLRGEVVPTWYESDSEVSAYLSDSSSERGHFGVFASEILRKADRDVDFSRFDNDGPDGLPDSGDDDGFVDVVFIAVRSAPRNFLFGPATGVASLGLEPTFVTADRRASGEPIEVLHGTIQAGRSYAVLAATISHEYGHILGLPDLRNVGYLRSEVPLEPAEDSAGIGAWGLMGWGALGWSGADGPNPFSAWSRSQLGWLERRRPTQRLSSMRLPPVEESGEIYEILLPNNERFLISNRQRSSAHYDRNMPAEGLLIWHFDPRRRGAQRVDLECADGKWRSSGFPKGTEANPETGKDNLDFWAHDERYTRDHAGNLGDDTDPFDGDRFRSFTPESNPSSASNDGWWRVRIEDIAFEAGGVATAQVEIEPLVKMDVRIRDENGDGVLVVGETAQIEFRLASWPNLTPWLQMEVTSEDTLITITDPVVDFHAGTPEQRIPNSWNDFEGELQAGMRFYDAAESKSTNGIPILEVKPGFVGIHAFRVNLSVYPRDKSRELLWMEQFPLEVVSSEPPRITRIAVVDSAGNGDGLVQAGEFIRLAVEVEGRAEMVDATSVRIRSLQEEAMPVPFPFSGFDEDDALGAGAIRSPEFLLASDLIPGTVLEFEIDFDSGYETSIDTLQLEVAAGGDRTPPRVLPFLTQSVPDGLSIVLPESRVTNAGPLEATGVIYSVGDTTQIATIALAKKAGRYEAIWRDATEETYLLKGIATDGAGNVTETPLHLVNMGGGQAGPLPGGVVELIVSAPVADLAYSPKGAQLAVATGTSIELYDPVSLRRTAVLNGHEDEVTAVAFSPNDPFLASGDAAGTVRLWDARSREQIAEFQGHESEGISGLVFSSVRPTLVSAGLDGSLDLWDVNERQKLATLRRDEPQPVMSLAMDPVGGNVLAAGSSDGSVAMWETTDHTLLAVLKSHRGEVASVAFNADGSRFVSAGRDRTARLRTGGGIYLALRQVLSEHDDWIEAAAFTPDGLGLATASLDGTIYLRRIDTSLSSVVKLTNAGGIRAIAFSPDGTQLTTGTWNGTLQFWQVWDESSADGLTTVTPKDAVLLPIYPNPFNQGTHLPFRVFRQSSVKIKIYDTLGQLVRELDVGDREPGLYAAPLQAAIWDGRNADGQSVASGVYVGVLVAGRAAVSQKMVVLR